MGVRERKGIRGKRIGGGWNCQTHCVHVLTLNKTFSKYF